MGDRYYLELRCDWCGEMNDDLYYAPSSEITTFKCFNCQKENYITMDFHTRKHPAPRGIIEPNTSEETTAPTPQPPTSGEQG